MFIIVPDIVFIDGEHPDGVIELRMNDMLLLGAIGDAQQPIRPSARDTIKNAARQQGAKDIARIGLFGVPQSSPG
jgi:hypothetical protein